MELVVDPDASRAGRAVRERLERGERVAGFVGDPDDPAIDELVGDVLHPRRASVSPPPAFTPPPAQP